MQWNSRVLAALGVIVVSLVGVRAAQSQTSGTLRQELTVKGSTTSAPFPRAQAALPPVTVEHMKRIRYSAPQYPRGALDQKLSGFVTVEFIVDTKGEPTEVHVLAAEPAGVFDQAALEAVRRWRYEPLVVDGVPNPVPLRTVLRFVPPIH